MKNLVCATTLAASLAIGTTAAHAGSDTPPQVDEVYITQNAVPSVNHNMIPPAFFLGFTIAAMLLAPALCTL